jgi:hypothetical protein
VPKAEDPQLRSDTPTPLAAHRRLGQRALLRTGPRRLQTPNLMQNLSARQDMYEFFLLRSATASVMFNKSRLCGVDTLSSTPPRATGPLMSKKNRLSFVKKSLCLYVYWGWDVTSIFIIWTASLALWASITISSLPDTQALGLKWVRHST